MPITLFLRRPFRSFQTSNCLEQFRLIQSFKPYIYHLTHPSTIYFVVLLEFLYPMRSLLYKDMYGECTYHTAFIVLATE
ncbi:hypothetical protein ABZP36_009559 [Zizania latifolia]